jgi:hypothetical protein
MRKPPRDTRGPKSPKITMKIRQNISIDPEVLEILKGLASAKKTSISGLITRWIMDEHEARSRVTTPVGNESSLSTPALTAVQSPRKKRNASG